MVLDTCKPQASTAPSPVQGVCLALAVELYPCHWPLGTLMSAEGSCWWRCLMPCARPSHLGVREPSHGLLCCGSRCGRCLVAVEKPRSCESHAGCCCWEGGMDGWRAALSQLVLWSPLQCVLSCASPPACTNKYLPTALCSPCLLTRAPVPPSRRGICIIQGIGVCGSGAWCGSLHDLGHLFLPQAECCTIPGALDTCS